MPNGSNRTEKQHYVPRVYLKGFAPQYLDKCSENSKSSNIMTYKKEHKAI